MEIVNVEQRSEEWFALRQKRMTASHAQAIGSNGKGLQSYVHKMMTDYYSKAEPERYTNEAMERGTALEDSAAFMYQMQYGREVQKVGFVIYNDFVGCSPDGFTGDGPGDNGLVEIKCPQDPEYFRMLLGGEIKPEYIWQVQAQMLICEKEWTDFCCYSPNYDQELIVKRVYPDPKAIEKLEAGFIAGARMIREIEAKMDGILKVAA
jgi:putative phage-type endonuclease